MTVPGKNLLEPLCARSDLRHCEEAEAYRGLFRSSRDGLLLVAPDTGTVLEVNPAMLSLLGLHEHQVVGQPAGLHFPSDRAALQATAMQRARVIGAPPAQVDFVATGGERVATEITVSRSRLGARLVDQWLVRDLRERTRLLAALAQAQKMEALGLMASGVTHDLNNMLAVVLSAADELRRADLQPPAREALDELASASHRGRDLLSMLLSFSRGQPGRHAVFDLRLVAEETARLVRRVSPPTLQVTVQAPPEPVLVNGEEGQWHQAVLNLAINGRDASAGRGEIVITVGADGDWARLDVRDHGQGMTEEVRLRALEPFFTTKAAGEGTGLGLALVAHTLRAHGGLLDIESAPGLGTVVHLAVPRLVTAPPSAAEAHATAPPRRILVVDDELLVRRGLGRMLRQAGHDVALAGSVAEARARLDEGWDVVVCDLTMPDENGAVLGIEALRREGGPRFIIMSGFLDDATRAWLREQGLELFLEKPFVAADLAALL